MNYQIEINLRRPQRPVPFNDESDDEFGKRWKLWHDDLQYKRFWRLMMLDGDGITAHHFAMESALFLRTENGSIQLRKMMEGAAVALQNRQSRNKNEIANLPEMP